MPDPDEQDPAAGDELARLRQAIRQAGRGSARLRHSVLLGAALLLLIPACVAWFGGAYESARQGGSLLRYGLDFLLRGVIPLAVVGLMAGAVVGFPAAMPHGLLRRGALRRRLLTIPRTERVDVLSPLRYAEGDVGRIVQPLIRELGLTPAELTPSPPPEARGDEPSPAG